MERKTKKTKYEDNIDPAFKWKDGESHDTLELHVEGFNKDQLKVQLNSQGCILVSGERPPNELMKLNGSRFHKQFKLSNYKPIINSATAGITAKLSHSGILRIKVPKSSTSGTDHQAEKRSSSCQTNNCTVDRRMRTMLVSVAVILVGFGAYLWLSYRYSISLSQEEQNSINNQTVLEVFPLPI